jgi:homogentisate 1,2-dioxygenase
MPFYNKRGTVPQKRHTRLPNPLGGMYHEELMTAAGFSGPSSLLYRLRPPTRVLSSEAEPALEPGLLGDPMMRNHMVRMSSVKPGGNFLTARTYVAGNEDLVYSIVKPDTQVSGFYRNGFCDELVLIGKGSGSVRTVFGNLDFGPLDLVVIPRGITSKWHFNEGEEQQYVILESRGPIQPPVRFRDVNTGQLLERSPYHERDLQTPAWVEPEDSTGEFPVMVKANGHLMTHWYDSHPFDAVGWDGYYFPFALNMRDYNPTVGRVHQMPDALQVLEAPGAVICCFSPAMVEDHPEALPAQAHHMSMDFDEIFYRVADEDRPDQPPESLIDTVTIHTRLLNHGPKPGYEDVPRPTHSGMFALMIDVAKPLTPARSLADVEDPAYMSMWV